MNICQKIYLRRKSKRYLYYIIFLGVFCVLCYQVYFLKVVTDDVTRSLVTSTAKVSSVLSTIRGVRQIDMAKYKPNNHGAFVCFDSQEEIEYSRINDDYCDCVSDGSDEPGTNACVNGKFYCETDRLTGYLPAGRVNDGICDCCDGSDEWAQKFPQGYPE
ncbi:Uncharacterized protein GBIM_18314, partial [Gryllus bimaculatus]